MNVIEFVQYYNMLEKMQLPGATQQTAPNPGATQQTAPNPGDGLSVLAAQIATLSNQIAQMQTQAQTNPAQMQTQAQTNPAQMQTQAQTNPAQQAQDYLRQLFNGTFDIPPAVSAEDVAGGRLSAHFGGGEMNGN